MTNYSRFQGDHNGSLDSYGIPKEFRNEFRAAGIPSASYSSEAMGFAIVLERVFVWVITPLAAIPFLLLTLRAAGLLEYYVAIMLLGLAACLCIRRTRKWRRDDEERSSREQEPSAGERFGRWLLSSLPIEIIAAIMAVLFLPLGMTDVPREAESERTIASERSHAADQRLVFLYELLANNSLEITDPGFLLGRTAPTIRPGGI